MVLVLEKTSVQNVFQLKIASVYIWSFCSFFACPKNEPKKGTFPNVLCSAHSLQLEKCCFSNPWPFQRYLMVRTFANLPADSLGSFSYYHVLSRDAFSEPQHYNGKVHFDSHLLKDTFLRSRVLLKFLYIDFKTLPCLIQVGKIACFLSSIKYRMISSWPKFGRGDSGLVFDGGDPHQGAERGILYSDQNGWIQWYSES